MRLLFFFLLAMTVPFAHAKGRIVADVNGFPITDYDVDQRLLIVQVLTGSDAKASLLWSDVLHKLIEDILIERKLEPYNIRATAEELRGARVSFATNLNLSEQAMDAKLKKAGVDETSFMAFLRSELFRQNFVQGLVLQGIKVNTRDVHQKVQSIIDAQGQLEFELQEILIGYSNDREQREAMRKAETVYTKVKTSADFAAMATLLSTSVSATTQGDIGWVRESALDVGTLAVLRRTAPNTVSEPIVLYDAVVIFFIKNIRPSPSINAADIAQYQQLEKYVENQMRFARLEQELQGLLRDMYSTAAITIYPQVAPKKP